MKKTKITPKKLPVTMLAEDSAVANPINLEFIRA